MSLYKSIKLLSSLCLGALLFSAPLASAAPGSSLEGDHDAIYLLASPSTETGEVKAGIYIELQKGWHTYWRNPGDAGEAPTIKAQLVDKNVNLLDTTDTITSWESPEKFSEGGLTTYGFEKHVFLPFTLHTDKLDPSSTAMIADVHWLVCAHTCIPRHAILSVKLSKLGSIPNMPSFAHTMKVHDAALPVSLTEAVSASFAQTSSNTVVVSVPNVNSKLLKSAYFFNNEAGIIAANDSQVLNKNGNDIDLTLKLDDVNQSKIENLGGVLSLSYQGGTKQNVALDTIQSTSSANIISSAPVGVLGFFSIVRLIILAFFGGLILNLMPCVFPVLALKAFSVTKMGSSEDKSKRLKSSIAYTLGVVGSFLVLGIGVIALRAAGKQIGWGFQFQSPIFILFLSWFLLALALNLLSVFEVQIRIPGQNTAPSNGLKGDFLTGLLAVVVASPCTAPFMGTALAAALNSSAFVAILLFAALGLGLAAPYPALALTPQLARFIPKPGAWMDVFKNCLAFPLLMTCVWLVWVGTQQTGNLFVLWGLGGGLVVAFCLWIYGLLQHKALYTPNNTRVTMISWIFLIAAFIPAILTVLYHPLVERTKATSAQANNSQSQYVTYSASALNDLRTQGKAVLVDMGADWCISCLVNEKTTLSNSKIQAYLAEHNITLMRGDWTNEDPEISKFLKAYKRDGVPLYVWFAPDQPLDQDGKVLPQVLTPSILLEAIKPAATN